MNSVGLARPDGRLGILLLLGAVGALLAPLCFLGYGTWLNIYMMLSAGASTWADHVPATSRPPGYWGYEAVMFVTSRAGGYVLTNALNLAISLADIFLVYRLAIRWRAACPLLCAAIVAVHPVFVIEATSSQDFNLSLLMILLGVFALDRREFWSAGLCLGLACLFRLSAIVPIAAIHFAFLVVFWAEGRSLRGVILSGVIAVALFLAACLPSYLVLGPTFYKGNLGPDEMWNATAWIGRFVYKVLYFFGGPLAAVAMLGLLAAALLGKVRGAEIPPQTVTAPRDNWIARHREIVLVWVSLAGCILLFAKYPIRLSYLIVALPFFALAVGQMATRLGRALPWIFVLALLSQNLVVFNIAKPDVPGQSTGGRLSPSIEAGFLLADIAERRRFIGCDTLACFEAIAPPRK